MSMRDKQILVAAGGGIAAFKTVELVRELGRRGARIKVALTPAATRFIGPLTFTALTGEPAHVDLWDPAYAGEVHVGLADWAQAIVVAPATANLLARAAHGFGDDIVLATLLCADCPILLAPAMHERMWRQAAVQRNLAQLAADGVMTVGPVSGALANGRIGEGRMAEPLQIADALERLLGATQDLLGRTIVISAGPTLEDLDPVRFISNRSSGKMGYALAASARERGARVVLISGPTHIPVPSGVELIAARSALEMRDAVRAQVEGADAIIMTAAVADYRPAQMQPNKIKKQGERMTLELIKNPDILAELGAKRRGARPVLVGFAMETNDVAAYGRKKLTDKRVDLIVANEASVAFGGEDTQASLITQAGDDQLAPMSKRELAGHILDRTLALMTTSTENPPARRPRAPAPARPPKGRSRSKG
jgi:phosphopantothenoylcysteine decarboxylase/phosphopantothenate--cysteine ligase